MRKPTDSAAVGTIGLLLYGLFGCRIQQGSGLCDVHSFSGGRATFVIAIVLPGQRGTFKELNLFRGKHRNTCDRVVVFPDSHDLR